MNKIPQMNDMVGFHDSIFSDNGFGFEINKLNNVLTMPPAVIISFGSRLDTNPTPIPIIKNHTKRKNKELINKQNQEIQNLLKNSQ